MFLGLQKFNVVTMYNRCINLHLYIYKKFSFFKYRFFINIFVTDTPRNKRRFMLNYMIQSIKNNNHINVVLQIDEDMYVKSITEIFYAASWPEREAWDMFGIFFLNHNNMQRLLVDYGFKGYPLRKDFPLSGYVEAFYNDRKTTIIRDEIDLVQEHRDFNYERLWHPSKPLNEEE